MLNTWLQTQKVTDQNCTNVVTKTTNDTTLNPTAGSKPSPVFTNNVTGLLPDVTYTLQVYPYNEAGVGVVANKAHITNQERKFTAGRGNVVFQYL